MVPRRQRKECINRRVTFHQVQHRLSIPIDPPAKFLKVVRASVPSHLSERPDPNTIMKWDGHPAALDFGTVWMFPV